MAIHHFHCTNGIDLVVDRAGRPVVSARDLERQAWRAVDRLTKAVPAYRDWAGWSLHVYDERGVVEVLAFEDVLSRDSVGLTRAA